MLLRMSRSEPDRETPCPLAFHLSRSRASAPGRGQKSGVGWKESGTLGGETYSQGPRWTSPNSGTVRDFKIGVMTSPAAKPPTWAQNATPGWLGSTSAALKSCITNHNPTTQKALIAKG